MQNFSSRCSEVRGFRPFSSNSATGPFTNVLTKSGAINTSSADPYYNAGVSLASYLGQSVYVEFKYTRGSSYEGDLAIDLVEVSSCRPITAPVGATCNLGSPNDFYTIILLHICF